MDFNVTAVGYDRKYRHYILTVRNAVGSFTHPSAACKSFAHALRSVDAVEDVILDHMARRTYTNAQLRARLVLVCCRETDIHHEIMESERAYARLGGEHNVLFALYESEILPDISNGEVGLKYMSSGYPSDTDRERATMIAHNLGYEMASRTAARF